MKMAIQYSPQLEKSPEATKVKALAALAKGWGITEYLTNTMDKAHSGERITSPHLNPYLWELEKEFYGLWTPRDIINEILINTGITRKLLKSKVAAKPKIYNEAGEPLTDTQVMALEKIIARALKVDLKTVRGIILKSALVGKFSSRDPLGTHDMKIDLSVLPKDIQTAIKSAGLTHREVKSVLMAHQYAAAHITNIENMAAHKIKMYIMDGIMQRKGRRQLAHDLMEDMAVDENSVLNRDWERIAITEANRSASDAYIAGVAEGGYVVGHSHTGACQHCETHVHNKVYKVTHDPPEDYSNYKPTSAKYKELAERWETEIWVGKSNFGRSMAKRKQRGGALVPREHHELGMPVIPLHPTCRCSWSEWIPGLYYIKDNRIEFAVDEKSQAEHAEWLKQNPHVKSEGLFA